MYPRYVEAGLGTNSHNLLITTSKKANLSNIVFVVVFLGFCHLRLHVALWWGFACPVPWKTMIGHPVAREQKNWTFFLTNKVKGGIASISYGPIKEMVRNSFNKSLKGQLFSNSGILLWIATTTTLVTRSWYLQAPWWDDSDNNRSVLDRSDVLLVGTPPEKVCHRIPNKWVDRSGAPSAEKRAVRTLKETPNECLTMSSFHRIYQ